MNESKINILLNALDERYKSIHIIRERVQTVSIWILGFLLAGASWIYQSENYFKSCEGIFLILIVICVWLSIWKFYFDDLKKGFNGQRQISAKIEESLGFYREDFFTKDEKSLYPKSWRNSGEKGSEGYFIRNTYCLLALGFILLLLSILSHINF